MATTPEQRDEASSNQAEIVYPKYGIDDETAQRPPKQPIEDSFRDQWYSLKLPQKFELRPSVQPIENIDDEIAARLPIFIVSAWNPRGEAQSYDQNFERSQNFYRQIDRLGISFSTTTTFANDGGWLEQSCSMSGITQEQAAQFAAELGQPAFVRWDATHLTVIPTAGSSIPPSQTGWKLTKLDEATCPVRNFARSQQCVPAGGPWVGASMLVGTVWQQHRGMAMSSVGCGVCDTGAIPLAGANGLAIPIRSLNVGSRYGGYFFSNRVL
ncbi:MAG: hypothetical protein RLZZ426_29 [Actinomycetota bacterium]